MQTQAILHTPGDGPADLRLDTITLTAPGPGEVLISVQYAGVNRPDLLQRAGLYPPPKSACPRLGLEVSGRVIAAGEGVEWPPVGTAVCALVPGGGYAGAVLAPAAHCLPLPATGSSPSAADDEAFRQGAALPEGLLTVWAHLVVRGGLTAQDLLWIPRGSSGIGHFAIQVARALGVQTVIASASSPEKRDFCAELGATEVLETDVLPERGAATVLLDQLGGPDFNARLGRLAPDGRAVLVGLMAGPTAEIDLSTILVRRVSLLGATLRALSDAEKAQHAQDLVQALWPAVTAGRIRARIAAEFPLAEAGLAHELMASGRHLGKILLRP